MAPGASDGPTSSYILAQSPIPDVGSPQALALARHQIDECVHGHEHCRRVAVANPRLPTRLVDCADLDHPRLVLTKEGECGEYLALSYVWGTAAEQTYQATRSNVPSLEAFIDASLLPATIRDAVYVTHTLGFRWLWVDSLCIIQDSDEDKLHEIGHMHHIYRYAHLTIIAGDTEKVTDSFLHERPALRELDLGEPNASGYITLPFICPPSSPASAATLGVHPAAQPHVGQVHFALDNAVDALPNEDLGHIGTRAWCMQEYVMSPRALVFTSRALHLRCLTATQAVGNGLSLMRGEQRLPGALFLPDPPVAHPGSELWQGVPDAWAGIVGDYSSRTASVASDKLVACAAVAQQFHRALRADYLAGLWRDTLLSDLLWQRDWRAALGRPSAYRAPSWSWAAVDGKVERLARASDATALAEIVKCDVTPKDAALPFGEVTSGVLVLRGTLLPCRRENSLGNRVLFLPSLEQARRGSWGLGEPEGDTDSMEWEMPSYQCSSRLDCESDEGIGKIWAVPLVRTEMNVHGLLLAGMGLTDEFRKEPVTYTF